MRLTKRSNSPNWFLEARVNGRNYVRSTKSSHKPTAAKIAEGLYRSLQVECSKPPSVEISLKNAANRYIASREHMPSASNLKSVSRVVLARISGNLLLSEITGQHLSDFVELRRSEGCKPQTVKHGLAFLCGVMKQARREGYSVSTVDAPPVPIKPTRLRYLSQEEENSLLTALDPSRTSKFFAPEENRTPLLRREMQDNYDLVVLLLDTGARYGEIASLKWEQIDLVDRSIKLWRSKVGNESIIYMTTRVSKMMCRRSNIKSSERYVFTNRSGGPRGACKHGIRRAIKRAGLNDVTIHTLRHTHATRLIQNGLSIYEVRSVLGHTDIKTTMRYAHLENIDVTQRARNVIEALNKTGPKA